MDFKGIWLPRWSIADNNKILLTLNGEFNHIFLQVFALGEAYYPSRYAPSKSGGEWLKDFLHQAHLRKIKVSAWINIFYSWGYAPITANPRHPINAWPQWYVRDKNGRSILDYNIKELARLGIEGYFISPANSEVRAYITKIIEEIIRNYDFDGIHLDYIRYPNPQFIYDVSLRTKFMRKFYFDPVDLLDKNNLKSRVSLWGYEDLENQWEEFISDDLTQFIKDLSKKIKAIKPNVQISAAVKPDYRIARDEYYQDWLGWLNLGIIDFICLMCYTKDIEACLKKTIKMAKEPHRVVVGLSLYNFRPEMISKQVKLVEKMPFAGTVFFSYGEIEKNKKYLKVLESH